MSCNTDYLKGTGSSLIMQLYSDGETSTSGTTGFEFEKTIAYTQPFTDESINPSANNFDSAAIVGGRQVLGTETSAGTVSGSTTIELNALNLGYLLFSALGGVTTFTTTSEKYVPSTNTIPFYDVWVYHGGSSFIQKYSCMAVNSLTFNLQSNAVVNASIDWIGLSTSSDSVSASSTPEHDHVYFSTDIASSGGITITHGLASDEVADSVLLDSIGDLSFTINNNLDSSAVSLNGEALAIEEGMADFTGSVSFYLPDVAYNVGEYKGGWSTDLAPVLPSTGDVYVITGGILGDVGDYIIFNGLSWDTVSAGTAGALAVTLMIADIGDSYLEGGLKSIEFKLSNTDSTPYTTDNTIALNNIKITNISHDITGQGLIQFNVDFSCINKADDMDSTFTLFPITLTVTKNSSKVLQKVMKAST